MMQTQTAHLRDDELSFTLAAKLCESLTGHVLDSWMGLVHELKELVDHCFEELPMIPQEPGILTNHVPAERQMVLSVLSDGASLRLLRQETSSSNF